MDYGKILESVRDISKYMNLYLAEIPLASEMQDILERNDWRDELKRRNFKDFSQTLDIKEGDEKENLDNELMPPPLIKPIKKEKVQRERKTSRTRSKPKVATDVSSDMSVRRSSRLNTKSVILVHNIETVVLDDSIETDSTFSRNDKTSSKIKIKENIPTKTDSESETEAYAAQITSMHKDVVNVPNEMITINKNRQQSSMESVYEEAQEQIPLDDNDEDSINHEERNPVSSTFIVEGKSPSSSGTFIVQKSLSPNMNTLSNVKPVNSNLVVKVKQLFNYMSPVRSKIENFEKLATNSKIPQTKSLKKAQPMVSKNVEETKNQLLNSKFTTPTNPPSKIVASLTTSSQKKMDLTTSKKAELTSSAQKRIDAVEATKKKAAMLQARAEESRQKREERQMRAQKMREVQESLKQKALVEAEKLKVQKLKNRLLEQNRTREQKSKLSELKRLAVINKIETIKGTREHVQKMDIDKPIYMTQVMPPLSTQHYVEDDDDVPHQSDILHIEERLDELPYIPRQIINTAFFLQPMTPNLAKIFPSIKETKLRRNSSAVWDKLPDFSKFDFEFALSEDDEENDYE